MGNDEDTATPDQVELKAAEKAVMEIEKEKEAKAKEQENKPSKQ